MALSDLLLSSALEKAIQTLLIHFQEQYGKAIFVPLGVKKDKTPACIAPQLASTFRTYLIEELEERRGVLMIEEERIAKVFDRFMDSFFASLNIFSRKILVALKMKMYRSELVYQIKIKNIQAPQTAIKRKKNLILIMETIFETVIQDLNANNYSLELG